MTDQIPIIVFHSRDYAIHSQVAFVQKLTCPFIAKSLGLEWIGVKHRKEMIMETVRIWDLSYLQTQQNISPCYQQVCNYWSDKHAKKYFKKVIWLPEADSAIRVLVRHKHSIMLAYFVLHEEK